jgi:hypothetical protein
MSDESAVSGVPIFHFSFAIAGFTSVAAMANGITTATHRLESGLVRLARRGTSALSKRVTLRTNGK